MAGPDLTTLKQRLTTLGLVTPAQLQECLEEVGGPSTDDATPLLRALERKGYLTPLQSDKLRKGDKTGYFLGGYRVLYKIASGSFGRVYRADGPNSGRIVAIKVLRRRWSDDSANVESFEREGRLGMSVRHPNIVEILSVGRDPQTRQYYIVMEFVEGGNLRDLLAIRKKFEPIEALRLLEDMVSALRAAYARGMTHRDIKLTNILLSTQGVAKLVDFGLAQTYSSGSPDADMQVQRTVDYAGLERATGVKPGDVRSDIYFLGCVFYEMLTGRPPLPLTRDRHARMRRERFENIPRIQPEEVGGHNGVIRLVETMMPLNPTMRYQTPDQVLEALRQVRRELEWGTTPNATPPQGTETQPSVFLVERDARLQDIIREKLKKEGYRVLVSADPERALDRFRQRGFNSVIVDAGTTREAGFQAFKKIIGLPCRGILILSEGQDDWAADFKAAEGIVVLKRPLKMGQLVAKLKELVPVSP